MTTLSRVSCCVELRANIDLHDLIVDHRLDAYARFMLAVTVLAVALLEAL